MTQRDLVADSLYARAAHDVGGPRRRHPSEVERLRAEVAGLRAEVALLRGLLAAAGTEGAAT